MSVVSQIFHGTRPSFTVNKTILDNGDSSRWTSQVILADGRAVELSNNPVYGAVALHVVGLAYQPATEGTAFWYKVVRGGISFFDGQSSPDTTDYLLELDGPVTVEFHGTYAGGGQGQGGCFTERTLVRMADGTDRPIGEVRAGDMVKAYNCVRGSDREELVDSEVRFSSAGVVRESPNYEKYTFSDGTVVEITHADRLYNVEDNKMKWMHEWEIGEHGLTFDGREVALVSHETVDETVRYHDFSCDYHNYFVNGMLAGQKPARWPFLPSRHKPRN